MGCRVPIKENIHCANSVTPTAWWSDSRLCLYGELCDSQWVPFQRERERVRYRAVAALVYVPDTHLHACLLLGRWPAR